MEITPEQRKAYAEGRDAAELELQRRAVGARPPSEDAPVIGGYPDLLPDNPEDLDDIAAFEAFLGMEDLADSR